MTFRRLLPVLFLLLVMIFPVYAQETTTLTVFAAASLTDAFEEIASGFEAETPGVEVVFNFGGSSQLAAQLAEGAPADVFASANTSQMTAAQEAGRIGSEPRTFVRNRLVLAVPADNPANINSLRDLANDGVKLVVAAPEVPVREYTDTMLERLAADPKYGEEYRAAVIANIVSEEDNVRQVSAKVSLGEADAGVVYLSDITPDIADTITTIAIPDAVNTIATYPIAVTDDTQQPELANAFVDYVLSDAGQETLVKWGFLSVDIPEVPDTVTLPTDGTTRIDGQVTNPLTVTAEDLRSSYTAQTVEVTYQSGEETVETTFTGVLLYDLLSAAQPVFNADVSNDKLSTYIVVTGTDGYQAVIAWGEIDPEFGNQPILLAYQENGAPLTGVSITDEQGDLRLVVPGDTRGGRYVRGVANISLRDAPAVTPME